MEVAIETPLNPIEELHMSMATTYYGGSINSPVSVNVPVSGSGSSAASAYSPAGSDVVSSSSYFNTALFVAVIVVVALFVLATVYKVFVNQSQPPRPNQNVLLTAQPSTTQSASGQGVGKEALKALPIAHVSQLLSSVKSAERLRECAVCLAEYQEEEELKVLPACRHWFHAACIDTWLKKHTTCPVCRADIKAALGGGSGEKEGSGEVVTAAGHEVGSGAGGAAHEEGERRGQGDSCEVDIEALSVTATAHTLQRLQSETQLGAEVPATGICHSSSNCIVVDVSEPNSDAAGTHDERINCITRTGQQVVLEA